MGLTYDLKDISCEAASALWLWESVEVQHCFTTMSKGSAKTLKVNLFNDLKNKKEKSEAEVVPNQNHICFEKVLIDLNPPFCRGCPDDDCRFSSCSPICQSVPKAVSQSP